jgi:hypothetical protein
VAGKTWYAAITLTTERLQDLNYGKKPKANTQEQANWCKSVTFASGQKFHV